MFAEIALPISLERTFTYVVPEALETRCHIGMRAVVPWRNRTATGYVVELRDTAEVERIKPIISLPDEEPIFSEELLALTKWIGEYYCCSWGEALQSAVPSGINARESVTYTLREEAIHAGRFTDMQKAVVTALFNRGPLTENQLAKETGRKGLKAALQSLIRREVVFEERESARPRVAAQQVDWVALEPDAVPPPEDMVRLQRRAPRQAAIYFDLLHNAPERAVSQLYEKHRANSAALRALEEKGYIRRFEREVLRDPGFAADAASAIKHELNAEQRAAYDHMTQALKENAFKTFLLRGITGSGKTEVYLQVIERALELGKSAIILVPEISLTPQTVARFKGRFGEAIAVLHSALNPGERYDEWRRAKRGDVRIVVGARSAIFAPVRDLGVVIVDEEHDTSYKQGEAPRYHARDVAVMRANLNKAICILGSATPSIESQHNSERGKFTRLELKTRATAASLPQVELIDMREEAKETGTQAILSRKLEAAVARRLEAKEQVILMLNRRGFSPFLICPSCGWLAECTDCNVSLTYHTKGGFMLCHYCNTQHPVSQQCPRCDQKTLQMLGHGTQKVEEYVSQTFPSARIQRMDADTTAGKGGHAQILGRFADGEIDILVGTQMIAKGHDYPGVTLVGVINGDTGLGVCDFRAGENTFQLLTQVGGRAGRGDRAGEVFIQTFRPGHYAIQHAARHDYENFYAHEIESRHQVGYPPFRRMATLTIESTDARHAERAAQRVGRWAREAIAQQDFEGMETMGPAPATIYRVQNRYRWHVALLSKKASRINTVARAVRDAFNQATLEGQPKLKIDTDPYGAM